MLNFPEIRPWGGGGCCAPSKSATVHDCGSRDDEGKLCDKFSDAKREGDTT